MAKVTSKLQVTIPRGIAREYGIKPGDEIEWTPAGKSIRVTRADQPDEDERAKIEFRLKMFLASVERQKRRERAQSRPKQVKDRGWKREDLYDRGRTR